MFVSNDPVTWLNIAYNQCYQIRHLRYLPLVQQMSILLPAISLFVLIHT